MSERQVCRDRGIALLIVLVVIVFATSVGAGVLLTTGLSRGIVSNHEDAAGIALASETALELAIRDLALVADWNRVLRGQVTSVYVDGPPGVRALPDGTSIDLVSRTNELTCGRATPCTNAQVWAITEERPWGRNNPRWRPFLHASLTMLPSLPRASPPMYVVVWLGDDARETDGDAGTDGAGTAHEGRYVLRARVEVFGARGARHAVEAELVRVCAVQAGVEICRPGVRLQTWRVAS